MSTLFHGFKKLRSDDLTLLYKDGEIRHLCVGRVQVLNAVYAAVRDQNWTTIPFIVDHENIEVNPDGFTIETDLNYSLEDIRYKARISIEVKGNKLLVNFDGEARSTFLRNRIGLCILHPIKECKGKSVLITHPDGSESEGGFPELISPDQPFFNISGMRWNPGKGISAALIFEGEIFESEDQRNWTDASYKTYCTPLDFSFPVKVEKGDRVHQSVTLVVEYKKAIDSPSAFHASPSPLSEKRILRLDPDQTSALPGLGIGRSAETLALTLEESEILSSLPFHHYRVDLHLGRNNWEGVYDSFFKEQKWLGWPLELVLHFGAEPGQELDAFLQHYNNQPVNIIHLLVFDQDSHSNSELLIQVVPLLKAVLPDVPLGGGSDANFAELNRFPPDPGLLDFISYSICPQIHAFDNLTLTENLQAQSDSVLSAMSLLNKPVSIGAISLKQRFNAVATNDEDENQSTPESDSRQHTSFAAAWTLGSIRNLALAGVASFSYFETVGPRGILSRQEQPEGLSPLYQLFREILTGDHMQVIHTESSHPLEFEGLALKRINEIILLIANYTESVKNIQIAMMYGSPSAFFKLEEEGWNHLEHKEQEEQILTLNPSGIYKITYSL